MTCLSEPKLAIYYVGITKRIIRFRIYFEVLLTLSCYALSFETEKSFTRPTMLCISIFFSIYLTIYFLFRIYTSKQA